MNIEFTGYLAQRAFHNTVRHNEANAGFLLEFVSNMMRGAWCDTESWLATDGDRPTVPVWSKMEGHRITKLSVSVSPSDCRYEENKCLAHEFTWCVQTRSVDKYGDPAGDWRTLISGIWFNHAKNADGTRDYDDPDWSSHT